MHATILKPPYGNTDDFHTLTVLLSLGTGLHWATLILGTSPGGIAEMAITAKVLQLGGAGGDCFSGVPIGGGADAGGAVV